MENTWVGAGFDPQSQRQLWFRAAICAGPGFVQVTLLPSLLGGKGGEKKERCHFCWAERLQYFMQCD